MYRREAAAGLLHGPVDHLVLPRVDREVLPGGGVGALKVRVVVPLGAPRRIGTFPRFEGARERVLQVRGGTFVISLPSRFANELSC